MMDFTVSAGKRAELYPIPANAPANASFTGEMVSRVCSGFLLRK